MVENVACSGREGGVGKKRVWSGAERHCCVMGRSKSGDASLHMVRSRVASLLWGQLRTSLFKRG